MEAQPAETRIPEAEHHPENVVFVIEKVLFLACFGHLKGGVHDPASLGPNIFVIKERSPPHPKDTGQLQAKRLNARHRQKLATLALEINKKGPKTINISPTWVPTSQNGCQHRCKIDEKSRLRRGCVSGAFWESLFVKNVECAL